MPIKIIKLKNFTVFKDFQLNFSPNINIFVGENGTGKTHLLKAIYAACEVSQHQNKNGTDYFTKCFNENQRYANLLHDKNFSKLTVSIVPTETEKKYVTGTEVNPVGGFVNEEAAKEYAEKNADRNYLSTYLIEVPQDKKFLAAFIPCKDMLTHSNGFLAMANTYQNFPFDKTLTDIVAKNSRWKMKSPPPIAKSILPVLEEMIDGEVIFENEDFFIKKRDGRKIIFNIEAEGLKKIGLLWQLLMTNSISEDSILLWDEPEANLNPKFLPKLAECLLQLSRSGVQIFLSTHNYIFAKYFDVLKNDSDKILFHSLYFEDKVEGVQVETQPFFQLLQHNDIADAFNLLLERVYEIQVGGQNE